MLGSYDNVALEGQGPTSTESARLEACKRDRIKALKPTSAMMMAARVRHFDAAVEWYRDVLGLKSHWTEQIEFCSLAPADRAGTATALASDHPDRIPTPPGVGWPPTPVVEDLDSTLAELRAKEVTLKPRRGVQTRMPFRKYSSLWGTPDWHH